MTAVARAGPWISLSSGKVNVYSHVLEVEIYESNIPSENNTNIPAE